MLAQLIKSGFINSIKLCLDELPREPKRILIIGGCRQLDFAQYMALLLPAVDIYLLDPDKNQVAKAQEEICCRFKFIHGTLESMPFEAHFFDFTMAHHLFEYVADWKSAMAEISRVTAGHFMFSRPKPVIWNLTAFIQPIHAYFQSQGLTLPKQAVDQNAMLTELNRYAKIKLLVSPIFWDVYMTAMKPLREERLILEPTASEMAVAAS